MKKLGMLILLISVSGLLGCSKEKAFEFVADKRGVSKTALSKEDFGDLKADQIAKLSPEERKKFLVPRIAVMSYGQTSRSSTASMPFYQGRTKLVEFEMTEKTLEVRELEKDPRYADNETNSKIIMTIPIRHVDYVCETDAYGECQNKEIEDEKKPWNERRYVDIYFEGTEILDLDELPVEMTNLGNGCYTQGREQKLIGAGLNKDVLNLELQRSYKIKWAQPECWGELGEVEDLDDIMQKSSQDIRYVFSMVREDKIASKDYKPVQYAKEDEGAFGFFNTKLAKLDVDNNAVENNDVVLMNRWNPAKKVITYHLSDSFAKPEYDYILVATQTAIENINQGLAEAQAGIQIDLKQPSGKRVGDLRNNMIVLVDDPLAARVIGYGPSAAHPITGEILNARTVMYFGTIKTIVKRTYEEMREEVAASKKEKAPASEGLTDALESLKRTISLSARNVNQKNLLLNADTKGVLEDAVNEMNLADKMAELKAKAQSAKDLGDVDLSNATLAQIKKEIRSFKKADRISGNARPSKFIDKRIEVLSKNNTYPEELVNVEFALQSAGINETAAEDLKPWEQLTSDEKEQLIRQVLPHIWIPTLVHEFGHNLGLRHNFAGSEDNANFYSEAELKKMGVNRAVPYSSVMDYSYKTINELPTMGKYDIAALKFAYKREVEAVNAAGEVVKSIAIKEKIADATAEAAAEGLTLKEYRYCTDEHASANPTCNRFDEGTNLVEIATHYITSYDNNYKRTNKRNSRKNFSVTQEGAYLGRMMSGFYDLRLSLELFERIKMDFGIPEGHELWTTNPFLKEIYEASALSGQFFLSILMTPDVHCTIAMAEEPRVPIALVPITNLDADATTCFHPDVQSTLNQIGQANGGLNLIASAEGGKSFRSKKDPLNQNAFADQIDVQGIWIDKLLALNLLFTREMGSSLFDKYNHNYLNHGAVGPHIENILAAIMLGRGNVNTPFKDADGNAAEFLGEGGAVASSLPISIDFGDEHTVYVPEVGGLSAYFGLPNEQTTFVKAMTGTLAKTVPASVGSVEANRFLDGFSVYAPEIPKSDALEDRYIANASNKIAKVALESAKYGQLFNGIDTKQIEALVELKKAKKKVPKDASAQIKAIYKLDVAILEAYVQGLIKGADFYENLLGSLIVK